MTQPAASAPSAIHAEATTAAPRPSRAWAWLAYAAAVIALAGAFTLYLHPAVLVTLADQVWACFN